MERKFKIASHDTMSYAKPEKWYLRPFHFVAKCQNLPLDAQYREGIRLFDMRVRWDNKNQCWKFAHGQIMFKMVDGKDVDWIFSWLDCQDETCLIRLLLEYNKPVKNMSEIEQKFIESCERWRNEYKNLQWFDFRRKFDMKKLYSYEGEPAPLIYQATSSCTSLFSTRFPWLDDWWPWLYAKMQNKDNVQQGTDYDYLSLDFIEIR